MGGEEEEKKNDEEKDMELDLMAEAELLRLQRQFRYTRLRWVVQVHQA